MSRYKVCSKVLREREYYDTKIYEDLFAYARAQRDVEGFQPDAAVIGVTAGNPNLYLLNLSAALMLEGVRLGKTRSQLTAEMLEIFDTEVDELESDIDETMATLLEANIIEEVSDVELTDAS